MAGRGFYPPLAGRDRDGCGSKTAGRRVVEEGRAVGWRNMGNGLTKTIGALLMGLVLPIAAHGQAAAGSQYAGSAACKTCHPAVYARWSKTRMANVVLDPKTHPQAILPDLNKPDPLVKFT